MNENLTNFQLSKLYHRWDALSILFLKNPEKIFENQRTETIKDENQSETSFTESGSGFKKNPKRGCTKHPLQNHADFPKFPRRKKAILYSKLCKN